MRSHGFVFVGRIGKRQAGNLVYVFQRQFVITLGRIDTIAHGSATDRQFHQMWQTVVNSIKAVFKLRLVTRQFLA